MKHSVSQYVDGKVHTNGIESFWAMLKRGHKGTYHKMRNKHLKRYVDEFVGRHNKRPSGTIDQMGAFVSGMEGKRIRYQDLIA
ncbi:MAG: transposase [Candidatus Tectomicrobia bacterium]|nr:transposase [Candidatus Tectomicrobia bacterium]